MWTKRPNMKFLQELAKLYESQSYNKVQKFIIMSWGAILYLDYLSLPNGKSTIGSRQLMDLADEYMEAKEEDDEDKLTELDEWINEGCPMKDGTKLLTRQTVDAVLTSAQHPAGKKLTLYRTTDAHDHDQMKPNLWVSTTTDKYAHYQGDNKMIFEIEPSDLVIDAHSLADDNEYIVSTNTLLKRKNME